MRIEELCTYAPKSGIKAGDATQDGDYMFFTSSEDESKRFSDYQFDGEGIIMGTGGNATLHYYSGKYAVSTDCVVLLPDGRVKCKYLYYFFLANMPLLEAGFKGAGLKHTNKKYIGNIELEEIPPQHEQDNIINVLDRIDRIIQRRNRELAAFADLIKARFVEMFGDPDTNPMGWTERPLSEMLNVLGGYAFKSEGFSEVDGIPVLRIGNINAGFFKPVNMVFWEEDEILERYIMYPGDLVMSLTGTVGKDDYGNVCILGNDYDRYYLNQRNAKLELKEGLDKYFLSQLLRFEKIKKRLTGISRGVRQANISNKDILNLKIPVPPIELQQQFASFVAQIVKSKAAIQKSLDETQLLFDSLMQKYFG